MPNFHPPTTISPGAAVYCATCGAQFGGMTICPFDSTKLLTIPGADPIAVAFYEAIA